VTPKVTFIVPCYKLAHLLPECIHSILRQTYDDFEILVMDDCSPDDTAEVARSFGDSRVKHVRNETNLGHLRNYNRGIELSKGKYVWLISADDRLRVPDVLERYVNLLERHPEVGYVFCPGVGLFEGRETRVINANGGEDAIWNGRKFLKTLLSANIVVAASGLARKECYEKVAVFPTDMPWAGDWYLWCVFALHYDVGYFAEPMVNYRTHELSMTNELMGRDPRICIDDDLMVWERTKRKAREAGHKAVAGKCRHLMGHAYASGMMSPRYGGRLLTLDECHASQERLAQDRNELRRLRAEFYVCLGDSYCWRHEFGRAFRWYAKGLWHEPSMLRGWLKLFSLCLADTGLELRKGRRTAAVKG